MHVLKVRLYCNSVSRQIAISVAVNTFRLMITLA